jgi:NAD(P)-dependent dehydrogenase (short-subunit alcohol dehydrogenase family)
MGIQTDMQVGREQDEKSESRVVLITGGTMGIGLATALAFARGGDRVVLTCKWGTVPREDVLGRFAAEGLSAPVLIEADVANDEDTIALLEALRQSHGRIDVFVSNVAFGLVVPTLEEYSKRALFKSIEYSAWPFVDYPRRIRELFGRYPRYIVGLSSSGPDAYCVNYDLVAASKAVMETLCRYLNYRLFDEGVRVNVVRSRFVQTASLRATFGDEFVPFADRFNYGDKFIRPEEVGDFIACLCSGLLDGVSGQTLMVDRGTEFTDNLMGFFRDRERLSLPILP